MKLFSFLSALSIGIGIWISNTPYPYAPIYISRLLNVYEWGYLGIFLTLLGVFVLLWHMFRFVQTESTGAILFSSKIWTYLVLAYFILCGLWDAHLVIDRLRAGLGFQHSSYYTSYLLFGDLTNVIWLILLQIAFYLTTKFLLIKRSPKL